MATTEHGSRTKPQKVDLSPHLLLLSRQQAAASLQCRLPRRPGGSFCATGQASTAPALSVRCMAVVDTASVPAPAEAKKRSSYEIITLTTWLLKREHARVIDGEMTIVLSSISTACKQIASLVQRAPISNLTGVQGAINVQGEDQKKLDVVSNELSKLALLVVARRLRCASQSYYDAGNLGVTLEGEVDFPAKAEQHIF